MEWLKGLHIIFMVTWFAGLFYLPRLFVYHAVTEDQTSHERFVVMERKLFIIMTIGAILTTIFGIWMISRMGKLPVWLHVKFAFVAVLIAYHAYCYKIMHTFKQEENRRSHVFYRWFNEAPAILLVVIVLLATTKAF